jgi:hypothetical protein
VAASSVLTSPALSVGTERMRLRGHTPTLDVPRRSTSLGVELRKRFKRLANKVSDPVDCRKCNALARTRAQTPVVCWAMETWSALGDSVKASACHASVVTTLLTNVTTRKVNQRCSTSLDVCQARRQKMRQPEEVKPRRIHDVRVSASCRGCQ